MFWFGSTIRIQIKKAFSKNKKIVILRGKHLELTLFYWNFRKRVEAITLGAASMYACKY